MAAMDRAQPVQSWEHGTSLGFPIWVQGPRLCSFPGYEQAAEWEVEQLGLRSAYKWDTSTSDRGLACYATVPALERLSMLYCPG